MEESTAPRAIRLLKLVSLIAVVALILASATTLAVAWLSKNRMVRENNVTIRLDSGILKSVFVDESGNVVVVDPGEQEQSQEWNPDSMYPGSTISLSVGFINESQTQSAHVATVGIQSPSVWLSSMGNYNSATSEDFDEIPVKTETGYAYLGTQLVARITGYATYELKVVKDSTTGEDVLTPNIATRVTTNFPSSDIVTVPLFDLDNPTATVTIKDFGDLEIQANHAIVFYIVIEFENRDESQNDFINFGATGSRACFSRTVDIRLKND